MKRRKHLVVQNPKSFYNRHGDTSDQNIDFKAQITCINNTNYDITVLFRDNLPIVFHKCLSTYAGPKDFIIRKTYSFGSYNRINEVINNLQASIDAGNKLPSDDISIVYQCLLEQRKINKFCAIAAVNIDRLINVDDLIKSGSCYVSDLDLMIYNSLFSKDMVHPYSAKAKVEQIFEQIPIDLTTSGIMLEIIDNENHVSNRFASICNEIVEIPVKQDEERVSGLYVTRCTKGKLDVSSCTLDEMSDRFGVHRTKEDAISAGQPDIIYKTKLREVEHEANLSKIKYQQEATESKNRMLKMQEDADIKAAKLKQDSEEIAAKIKRESEQQKIKYEEELRESERKRQDTKDYYEQLSANRKNNSESLKNIGVMIAATLTILAVIQKSK